MSFILVEHHHHSSIWLQFKNKIVFNWKSCKYCLASTAKRHISRRFWHVVGGIDNYPLNLNVLVLYNSNWGVGVGSLSTYTPPTPKPKKILYPRGKVLAPSTLAPQHLLGTSAPIQHLSTSAPVQHLQHLFSTFSAFHYEHLRHLKHLQELFIYLKCFSAPCGKI